MNTAYISATELKNKVSDILNQVYYEKKDIIIERFGKPIVKIVPVEKGAQWKKNIKTVVDKYYGIMPDFPDVTKMRYFRKRDVSL